MNHDDVRAQVEAYTDETLPPDARHEIERHARDCADCASLLAAAAALRDATRGLRRDVEPRRDLWPALEAELRRRSRPKVVETRRAAPRPAWRWFGALAAGLAAIAVSMLWFETGRDPGADSNRLRAGAEGLPGTVEGLERECMGAGRSLQASLQLSPGTLAPDRAAAWTPGLSAGMAILDQSIDETRTALQSQPGDPALQRMLAARYQQKLALLNAALIGVEKT